jgi:ABC-type glycerol-3-phosphate transport system substrate-binding protein
VTAVSRRTLLRGLAGGAAGPLLLRAAPAVTVLPLAAASCAADRDTVQIVVVWSGRELEMFRRVLNTWRDLPPIQLISAGNGIEPLLNSRINAGNPPHIAVLSQPGLLSDLYEDGHLMPLEEIKAPTDLPPLWRPAFQGQEFYGVPLKATHKSVFWHRLRDKFEANYQPTTLGSLTHDLKSLAGGGHLGIGAADGWVLTDWFENALLAISSDVYDRLAKGENCWGSDEVHEALTWLGEVWRTKDVLAGGPERALLTQYDEAAIRVLGGDSGSGVTFEGDFIAPAIAPYQQKRRVDRKLGTFRFPAVRGNDKKPLVVGGDFAVRLKDDQDAKDVLEWLAGKEAAILFAEHGFLTVHEGAANADYLSKLPGGVPDGSNLPGLFAELARQLHDQDGSVVRFDLSDQLKGGLAGGDGQGIWWLFQNFFAKVTSPSANVDEAVKCTQGALVKAAGKVPD